MLDYGKTISAIATDLGIDPMGLTLIQQPLYSPELNSVELVFEEVRRRVEGKIYPDLGAKKTCCGRST